MRTGLIIFGIIFLVIGSLLYFVPMQQIKANTTTTDGEDTDIRTSSASITIPVGWAYASMFIGFILFGMGLVIPNYNRSNRWRNSKRHPYKKIR